MEEVNNQELEDLAIDSKYRKILIAAKRSKQLQRGAKPRLTVPNAKPTRVALEEVEHGLIDFEVIDQPQS